MEKAILTEFEQATCEQLVSCKMTKREKETDEQLNLRIEEKMQCPKFIDEAKALVVNWNKQREEKGLVLWV
jgi:hypothetical protein